MKNEKLIFFLLLSITGIASAQIVQLPSTANNILNYAITINKTPTDIGILTFNLTGSYQNIQESYQDSYANCTITNSITCNVTFIAEPGAYDSIAIFVNGNYYNNITLSIPISTSINSNLINSTFLVQSDSFIYYVIGAIIIILIVGNIIYLVIHKDDINHDLNYYK